MLCQKCTLIKIKKSKEIIFSKNIISISGQGQESIVHLKLQLKIVSALVRMQDGLRKNACEVHGGLDV